MHLIRKQSALISLGLLLFFIVGGFLCLSILSMDMEGADHISFWQATFANTIPLREVNLLSILFATPMILAFGVSYQFLNVWKNFDNKKLILAVEPELIPHSFLSEAFSSGILNPKIF